MKNKIIKNKQSNIEFEFYNGFGVILGDGISVTLGKYPNARWDIIEKAIKYAKEMK